jgi:stage IV sporulation protein FB
VRIHVTFVVAGLIMALSGYFWHVVVLAGSILFHEFGHLAAASWMGAEISEIQVWPFGATARLERSWQLTPPAETLVAFMGPFNSGILLGLASALERGFMETRGISLGAEFPLFHLLIQANLGLMLINLIPCLPLDGGRILRSQVSLKVGYVESTKSVATFSISCGTAMIVLGLAGFLLARQWQGLWLSGLLIGPLVIWGSMEERAGVSSSNFMEVMTRTDRLRHRKAIPVQEIMVPGDAKVSEVVTKLRPSKYNVILVAGRHMGVMGKVTETKLLEAYFAGKVNLRIKDLCFCDPPYVGYNGG